MYIFIILCLFSQSVFALKTLNRISDANFPKIIYEDTNAILDGKLYFLASGNHLWSIDGTASTATELQFNQQPVLVLGNKKGLTRINDNIVYVNVADRTLWRTDGVNFQQLSDVEVHKPGASIAINAIGDFIVAKDVNNNRLVVSDGNSATTLDLGAIENINIDTSVCVLEQNNIVIVQDAERIYSVTNNSVSNISTNIFAGKETSDFKLKLSNNGECFYQYKTAIDGYIVDDIFNFNANDGLSVIQAGEDNVVGWQEAVVFNGDVLLFPRSGGGNYKYLHRLSPNSLVAQKINAIKTSGSLTAMSASENFFYLQVDEWFGGVRPPGLDFYTIYNQDLDKIDISYKYFSKIISTSAEDILWYDVDVDYVQIISNADESDYYISAAEISIKSILADNKNTYIFGNDRSSPTYLYSKGFYKISNEVPISKQLNGLWVDNNWASQGLSIHTGIRADRTEYIFVSFYIYRDGKPFWVAGNKDIDLGKNSITIDLSEYTGESFLPGSVGQPAQNIFFGNAVLNPAACDKLQVTININNEEPVSLAMDRIDNIAYNNYCTD